MLVLMQQNKKKETIDQLTCNDGRMVPDHQPEQAGGEKVQDAHDLFNETNNFEVHVHANQHVS